jgi:hypothetical protein
MTPKQNEELRHAALHVLAVRFPTALHIPAIRRRLDIEKLLDFQPADADIEAAMAFLVGITPRPLLQPVTDGFGATHYWKATADGVLAWERGTF